MKHFLSALTIVFVVAPLTSMGQVNMESPAAYMRYLNQHEETLSRSYLSYMSEVAHGHKARKMEQRREGVVDAIRQAIRDCNKVKPYNGDISLREAQKEYYSVLLSVFNEDYEKIVDMEEIAERSYDGMEAYLLTQEKAREKLDEAFETLDRAVTTFAIKNNVRLTEAQTTKVDRKLAKVGKVNYYMNQVYLVFFKSTVQETLLLEALNKKDINAMEQSKNSMLKFAIEGLQKLDTLRNFQGDGSLINACRKTLEFQKDEAENKIPRYADFLMKEEEFLQNQKAFENKPSASRTRTDVESFNASVNKFNMTVSEYNKMNKDLNNARTIVLDHWEATRKRFLVQHVPKS